MAAGPVHWGSYPGEYLERLMAVFVAQDHPGVIRRTPASGDGGIDLLLPDGAGYEVHQVKGFHDRLGSSEKAQIEKSWRSVTTKPRLGRPITAYRLVVPVDPTPDEQGWFEELTSDAPFSVSFLGKPHWDSLAAQHPHVVDYMLAGGRERVLQRAKALFTSALDPSRPLTPLDVAASLDILRSSLNREDPHYRYQFATSDEVPEAASLTDCAVAKTRSTTDGDYLTIKVIPKHGYSLEDEPIKGSLNIQIEDPVHAREFNEALEAFTNFGRALDLPDGSLFASLEMPGGLGGEVAGGGGRIGPSVVQDPPKVWRLAIRGDDGDAAAELTLNTTTLTRGAGGGAELKVEHPSGVLRIEVLLAPPVDGTGELTFKLSLSDPAGHRVVDVVEPIRLASLMRPSYQLELLGEFGTTALATHRFGPDESLVPEPFAQHIADLATIQPLASFPIQVPDHIDGAFAAELRTYARMLRGEVITGTWDEVTLNLKPEFTRDELAPQFANGGAFVAEEQWLAVLDDDQVDLGLFATVLADARLADEQPSNVHEIRLVPGMNHAMTKRRGSAVPQPG